MIKAEKRRNSTQIDELAFLYGISRDLHEDVESFRHRLYKCIKGTPVSEKDSFYESLGYITNLQNRNILKIYLNEDIKCKIEITSTKLNFYKNDVLFYSNTLKNIKFFKNLKELFERTEFSFLNVVVLEEGNSWEYLKVENLKPSNSDRNYLNLRVLSNVQTLPKEIVTEVKDFSGLMTNNMNGEELVSIESNYAIEENNILHKYRYAPENISFNYSNFPFTLSYMPIKACSVNDTNFDYILKETNIDYEVYGFEPSQEKETERFISQEGSVIINKILEKQNTYWGE